MKNGKGEHLHAVSQRTMSNAFPVEILVNDQGNRITPSWVAFTDEERLVGDAAKNQYSANPGRTIFDIVSRIFGIELQQKLTGYRNVSLDASSKIKMSKLISRPSHSR
jgi:molecular chaperone DnaK (HSP70)